MKNKIISFILGFLIGAIIATLGFYIYEKSTSNQNDGMPDGNMPQMMQQGVTDNKIMEMEELHQRNLQENKAINKEEHKTNKNKSGQKQHLHYLRHFKAHVFVRVQKFQMNIGNKIEAVVN